MNDEIKGILRTLRAKSTRYEYCLKENISYNDESYEAHLLLDYITKLQELCDKYEEEHSNEFKIWKEERHELLDYKSRCEKAIEYIKENQEEEYVTGKPMLSYWAIDNLLNILEGKNEHNK